jgi:hypothetical protein
MFRTRESADRYEVALTSDDAATGVWVRGRRAEGLPATSVFRSLDEASAFFRAGSLGYSPAADPARFQGLELRCRDWRVEPLAVEEVRSSFFEDLALFPKGSIDFDCALLMRGIAHEWHGRPDLCCAADELCSRHAPRDEPDAGATEGRALSPAGLGSSRGA